MLSHNYFSPNRFPDVKVGFVSTYSHPLTPRLFDVVVVVGCCRHYIVHFYSGFLRIGAGSAVLIQEIADPIVR